MIDQTVQMARERFAAIYGAPPYLVGEEMLRSFESEVTNDRWRRIVNFDAVFSTITRRT